MIGAPPGVLLARTPRPCSRARRNGACPNGACPNRACRPWPDLCGRLPVGRQRRVMRDPDFPAVQITGSIRSPGTHRKPGCPAMLCRELCLANVAAEPSTVDLPSGHFPPNAPSASGRASLILANARSSRTSPATRLSKSLGVSPRPGRKPHGKTGATIRLQRITRPAHRNYLIVGADVMVRAPAIRLKNRTVHR